LSKKSNKKDGKIIFGTVTILTADKLVSLASVVLRSGYLEGSVNVDTLWQRMNKFNQIFSESDFLPRTAIEHNFSMC